MRSSSAQQLSEVVPAEAREQLAGDLAPERSQQLQRRPALGRQIEAVGAPVALMRPPLHQALLAQPVDEAHERDGLNLQGVGQLRLGHALAPLQPEQHAPLRPRHAVTARTLVHEGARGARRIDELEQHLALGGDGGHAYGPVACS